jgi:TolB-like protein
MKSIVNTILYITFILLPLSQVFSQTITVAVLDFNGANISKDELTILADRLSSEIFKLGEYTVVERSAMDEILSEQGFQQSGCTTTDCAVEVGALLGVQKMVTGSIGKIGNLYTITAKSINVETGGLDNQISLDVSGTIEVLLTETMSQVSKQLFRIESEELISNTSLSNDLPERKKSSSKKILYATGATLVAGGLAYFYINQSDEEEQTGSVSIAIEIPN